tara:strand:+ start:9325 stop:10368 length:1044 start_codon:yes stop_codon:yes gene_type:complete
MEKFLNIGDKKVGEGHPCFFIAEIGSNHDHDYEKAIKLIDLAAEAKVDAVKFQTFKADEHYSKLAPKFEYLKGKDTYSLIESLEINRDWHAPLKEYCESVGLIFISSPCDYEAVDQLAEIDMQAYKVASFDLPDTLLIKKIAQKSKPIILSTGMANMEDIRLAVNTSLEAGNSDIALLQCTSIYPAPSKLSNLNAIKNMKDEFNLVTGYSDHTMGNHICLSAVSMGASIIEKHYTLSRNSEGPDHGFAIEPDELKLLMIQLREVEEAMGDGIKDGPREEELDMFKKGRRSIHAAKFIKNGEKIYKEMLVIKRPGLGLHPKHLDEIIGKKTKRDIKEDEWITLDALDL